MQPSAIIFGCFQIELAFKSCSLLSIDIKLYNSKSDEIQSNIVIFYNLRFIFILELAKYKQHSFLTMSVIVKGGNSDLVMWEFSSVLLDK